MTSALAEPSIQLLSEAGMKLLHCFRSTPTKSAATAALFVSADSLLAVPHLPAQNTTPQGKLAPNRSSATPFTTVPPTLLWFAKLSSQARSLRISNIQIQF